MLRSIDHSSTLTIVHTAMRPSFGNRSAGRSTIAEYGMRSLGNFISLIVLGYAGHGQRPI